MLTRRDADALFAAIAAHGPRDLFFSADLLRDTRALEDLRPWAAERLPRLDRVYALADRGPGGRLLHFVRRAPAS